MRTPDDLRESACRTAETYMKEAKARIDESFGKGTALKKPELVAAYMQAASLDYFTECLSETIRNIEFH